ncbi:MAG: hypothetical protein PHR87_00630 [Sulfurospirillaceae bacterium]|nr:hypothetical protein [Sulfurospirillaceae bacterium]
MVKQLFVLFLLTGVLSAQTIYEKNCLPCHKGMAVKIDKFFYRYLLKYSSEQEVKKAMIAYLQNPNVKDTILVDGLINRFGVKKKTTLTPQELQEAIDSYWQEYNVFDKLK